MQQTSNIWKTLLADRNHRKEYKVNISGAEYGQDKIIRLSRFGALFSGDTPTVGACVSGQASVGLWSPQDVPRCAEVKVFVRLTNGNTVSEWLQLGVYYVDTRDFNKETNVLTLECYDAMLKAEQVYLLDNNVGTWPRTQASVVSEICERIGVELDDRTTLNASYQVEYPNDLTMREILGFIGAAHGGNWTMTPTGKLRLVVLGDLPEEMSYLIDELGNVLLLGGVRIVV